VKQQTHGMSSLQSTKVQYPCTLLQDKLFKQENKNSKVHHKISFNANAMAGKSTLESSSVHTTGLLSLSQYHHSHLKHFLGFLIGLLGNNSCTRNHFCTLLFDRLGLNFTVKVI
jgi:hypothetical protein